MRLCRLRTSHSDKEIDPALFFFVEGGMPRKCLERREAWGWWHFLRCTAGAGENREINVWGFESRGPAVRQSRATARCGTSMDLGSLLPAQFLFTVGALVFWLERVFVCICGLDHLIGSLQMTKKPLFN